MNRKAFKLLGLALVAGLLIWMVISRWESTGFVERTGAQLMLNGSPFRMIGWNMYLPNCITPSSHTSGGNARYTLAQMESQLAEVQANTHATVVRLWMLQEYGGPNNWSNFDRLIAAANTNHIKIVAVLGNNWGDCEPMVHGVKNRHYLAWYETGYKTTNDGYPLSFRAYAAAVAAHYATSPAIASWEIMNEPTASNPDGSCTEASAASALRAFADDMTAAIKAADPNHLVSLGDAGWCGGQGVDQALVYGGAVDLCEADHDYSNPATPIDAGYSNRMRNCVSTGKPIIIGEAGIRADVAADGTNSGTITTTTLRQRAAFLDARMSAYINAGAVGFIYWDKKDPSGPVLGVDPFDVGTGDPAEAVIAKYVLATAISTPVSRSAPVSLTATATAAGTLALSPTAPLTAISTVALTATATFTAASAMPTLTPTGTATYTQTVTLTATPDSTPTATTTPFSTSTGTAAALTATPATPSSTPSGTGTATPVVPTATLPVTPTSTSTVTATATAILQVTPTSTPIATGTTK